MKYIVLDTDGYGIDLVDLTEEEFDALSDKDIHIAIDDNSFETIDDYTYRKWIVKDGMSFWVDDFAKRSATEKKKRDDLQAILDAEEASRLAAIIPLTDEEIAAQAEEHLLNHKNILKEQLSTLLKQNLENGALYNDKKVFTDQYSLILLNGAFTLAMANQWPSDGVFKLDDILVSVTGDDIKGIFAAVQNNIADSYKHAHQLSLDIDNITIETIDTFELVW
jgi:hypothetical protein